MEEFCKGCGLKIKRSLFGGTKAYEFEDGSYCEKCARAKVDKARKS